MATLAVQSTEIAALPYLDVPVIYAASDRARVFYDVADASVESFVREPHRVRISDARGVRDRLSLDDQGFILADHRSSLADDPDFIAMNKVQQLGWPEKNRRYVDEIAPLMQRLSGADVVVPQINQMLVRTSPHARDRSWVPASGLVHLDYTQSAVTSFLAASLQAEGLNLADLRRVVLLQTWQVLTPAPNDNLLALCDGNSIDPADIILLETKVGKPGHPADVIESRLCRYAEGHRWYYFSNLGPHEMLVFKGYDSEDPSSTKAAHVAFDDPSNAAPGLRTSVEARFFCLFT